MNYAATPKKRKKEKNTKLIKRKRYTFAVHMTQYAPTPLKPFAHLHLAHGAVAQPIALRVRSHMAIGARANTTTNAAHHATSIQNGTQLCRRSRTTAWMPDGAALQIHFLAIAKRITALGASRARRVEVMVLTGLQHLAADEAIAVGTLDAKRFLVALFAVRHTIFPHVLAVQHSRAILAPKTPDVPLSLQGHQRLALLQLIAASGTFVGIVIAGRGGGRSIRRMTSVLVSRGLGGAAAGDLLDGRRLHLVVGMMVLVAVDAIAV